MKILDSYALIEISNENEKFIKYFKEDFAITDITLAEFYGVILREFNELTADYWFKKLSSYSKQVSKEILIEAVKFRYKNKEKNLSFFDCAAYIFAKMNNFQFVTGDKEFKNLGNVEFIQR